MKRHGFILVEWMIQFMLCTLIGMIAFVLFRTWSTRLNSLHKGLDIALQMPNAYDILRRDLQSVSGDHINVRFDKCRISMPGKQIVWCFKNNTLFRSQKKYDGAKWRKSVQNVVVEKAGSCSFAPIQDMQNNTLAGVQMKCVEPVSVYIVSLRNGKEL